jgi:uncharacterized lipoprotein YajG
MKKIILIAALLLMAGCQTVPPEKTFPKPDYAEDAGK